MKNVCTTHTCATSVLLCGDFDIPVLCPGLLHDVIVEGHGWCIKRLHPDFDEKKMVHWENYIQCKSLHLNLYVKVYQYEEKKHALIQSLTKYVVVSLGSSVIVSIQLVNAHKAPYTSCSPQRGSHDPTSKRIFNKATGPPVDYDTTRMPDPSTGITLIS